MESALYKLLGLFISTLNFIFLVSIPVGITLLSINLFQDGVMHLLAGALSFLVGLFVAGFIFKHLQSLARKFFELGKK